ncbi:pentapeptide repeat-containing protein [Gloeocapsa sp. BRSZ]
MNSSLVITTTLLATIISPAVASANTEEIQQLLSTKDCQNCNLSGAGLVLANLSGANLSGANLSGANLSRANLSGANLVGANLMGASLFGANLSGTILNGSDLSAADLRETYLVNASLTGAQLSGANFQGAVGIPHQIGNAQDFYGWGVVQGKKGDPEGAIAYFNQALTVNPDYAAAYLARGVARYQLFDRPGALQDAKQAEKLFLAQANNDGLQTAQIFINELENPPTASVPKSKPNFMNFLGAVGSTLLRFLF